MNLDDLSTFVKVVHHGGVAAAARALNVSKSSVSRAVGRLESGLGVRLLDRAGRQVVPTQEGTSLYERTAGLVSEAETVLQVVGLSTELPRGKLRVSAARALEEFLAPVVSRYAEHHAEVRVEVLLTDRQVDLVEEGVDLAIRGSHRLADSALVARRFASIAHLYCASPSYLARRRGPRAPEELSEHECITTGETGGEKSWPVGEGKSIAVVGRLHATSMGLARELALRGRGIAMLPAWCCAADLRAGRLRQVLKNHSPPPLPQWLVHPGSRVPARVRAFESLLVEQAHKTPGWLPSGR